MRLVLLLALLLPAPVVVPTLATCPPAVADKLLAKADEISAAIGNYKQHPTISGSGILPWNGVWQAKLDFDGIKQGCRKPAKLNPKAGISMQ